MHSLKLDWSGPNLPAYLMRSPQSTGLATGKKKIDTQLKALRARMFRVVKNPTKHDPVYKVAQRLFRDDAPCNLSRSKKERFKIRRLARKRFMLGYPPRKAKDTSIGDAVNWEWIVSCAVRENAHIVIVSRDTDYGINVDKTVCLNDWLQQEFRERVSAQRKITLTRRLSEGLQLANVNVTEREEKAERDFLRRRASSSPQFVELPLDLADRLVVSDFDPNVQIMIPGGTSGRFETTTEERNLVVEVGMAARKGYTVSTLKPKD